MHAISMNHGGIKYAVSAFRIFILHTEFQGQAFLAGNSNFKNWKLEGIRSD